MTCPPLASPPGYSLEDNIALAQSYAATHSPKEILLWFYEMVRNKGPWDYKQQESFYQPLGNWNYGAVGAALGMPDWLLERMAGVVQIRAGTWDPSFGLPFMGYPYGDDPQDQQMIVAGIKCFKDNFQPVKPIFQLNDPYGEKSINPETGLPYYEGYDFWPGDTPGIGQDAAEAGIEGSIVVPPPIDPLVLDLDGDGIETTGRGDAVVVFDLDGDGVKTGTGWVKPDDAWLVRDLNGNGTIDTGAELFGVDTVKRDGTKARDGFDALADLDENQDGWMDAQDAAFASLRIWRDLNQDGISQAGELQTLAQAGIVAISTGGVAARLDLGNGNTQTAAGTFIRSDGATGSTGETRAKVANLDLMVDTFNRTFTDKIALSDAAKGLPNMRGSGQVRDLREAMSLSPDLAQWVQTYSVQSSRAGQVDLLDGLIQRWADTTQPTATGSWSGRAHHHGRGYAQRVRCVVGGRNKTPAQPADATNDVGL
jgi:hypothetical protein